MWRGTCQIARVVHQQQSRIYFYNPSVVSTPSFYWKQRVPPALAYRNAIVYVDPVAVSAGVLSRGFHTSAVHLEKEPLKPSSKVEESLRAMKEDQEKEMKADAQVVKTTPPPPKRTLWVKVVDELKHYYHGFRLLFLETRISWQLFLRVLRGEHLSRREKKQLVRTTSDLFRLVPFSVFIIVPFMEFTLPIFLKLFPNMLPSTFQTANEKEAKLKASLKVKLEMAKFLQQTLDEMSLKGKGHQSETAKQFMEFFTKIRSTGEQASNEDIIRFSKLFEDEITLDSLNRAQLTALCRVLEIQPIGTNNLLRFQLRMRLRSLAADDKLIQKEGVDSLTISELQGACRTRGMRAIGVSEERLRSQLQQWLDLSLNEKVPPSLLLLSRALYLPDSLPTSDVLKAAIASLPEEVATQTKDAISQREGKIDNAARIEALKLEEAKIKEERRQKAAPEKARAPVSEDQETLVDKAPVVQDKAAHLGKETGLTSADLAKLEDALENIGVERKRLLLEKEELDEIKTEMAEYQEDVEDLKQFISATKKQSPEKRVELQESKAARRLFKSVNSLIGRLDNVIDDLEHKQHKLAKKSGEEDEEKVAEEIVSIAELINAIKKLQGVEDSSKLQQIVQVLGSIDLDRDGAVKVDDVMKVIELLGQDEVKLDSRQLSDILEMLNKEESLEMEEKIGKVLARPAKEAPGAGGSEQLLVKQQELEPLRSETKTTLSKTSGDKEMLIEEVHVHDKEEMTSQTTRKTKILREVEGHKKVEVEQETRNTARLTDDTTPPQQQSKQL